jgi:carbon storage regulator
MLVLSRKVGEKVVIGNCICVTVVDVKGNKVKLGISAPDDVSILRSELAHWLTPPADAPEWIDYPSEYSLVETASEQFVG